MFCSQKANTLTFIHLYRPSLLGDRRNSEDRMPRHCRRYLSVRLCTLNKVALTFGMISQALGLRITTFVTVRNLLPNRMSWTIPVRSKYVILIMLLIFPKTVHHGLIQLKTFRIMSPLCVITVNIKLFYLIHSYKMKHIICAHTKLNVTYNVCYLHISLCYTTNVT